MKNFRSLLPVAATLLLAAQAAAQSTDEERLREAEAKEVEFAERMREAEIELEEAARRVAELSTERLGSMGDIRRFAFEYSNKPRLGVTIEEQSDGGPVEGVTIIGVSPGSAAHDAGIRTGDIMTSVNGESLSAESMHEANVRLLDFMKGVEEGDTLEIEYLREGNVAKVNVKPRPVEASAFAWMNKMGPGHIPKVPEIHVSPEMAEKFQYRFGPWHGTWGDMELVELTEGLGRYFGTDSGLLVISAPKSNAFKLQEGDVIESIDGREPSSVNQCMRILGSYEPGEKLVLNIMRDMKRQKIEIEVPDDRSSWLVPELPRPVRPARAPLPAPAVAPVPAPKATERT